MSNFKRVIEKRKQEAAAQPPPPKDPGLMTEEELDRATREERSAITSPGRRFFLPKKTRRYWK